MDYQQKDLWWINNFMTMQDGVFCCGNALHVNDLVDYVSESGKIAGKQAATISKRVIKVLVTGK